MADERVERPGWIVEIHQDESTDERIEALRRLKVTRL
jgi:hypothetical protein